MTQYSHSKISTYENCPQQYKFRYVDKVEVDIPNTIEAYMGSIVHKTLEKIYRDKKEGISNAKVELLDFYAKEWDKDFSDKILIVKKEMKAIDYKKMGWNFIVEYFNEYFPFNQLETIGIETEEMMKLPDGNDWHIRIDRLAKDKFGNYYVCDYKTSSRMKEQYQADNDRQLAMYSIWVRNKFEDAKSIRLVWHMLAFNEEVRSERTEEQERKIIEEVLIKIARVEQATRENDFPTRVSRLCDYCVYKSICPAWNKDKTT